MNDRSNASDLVVLLIEDDVLQAESYVGLLSELGIIVMVADRYEQAMRLVRRHAGIIDYIVCDNCLGAVKAGAQFRDLARRLGIGCTVISARHESDVDFVKPIGADLMRALVYSHTAQSA